MEGKETRFGIANSALYATVTTDASCGAVNAMHDSFTPLGGLVPMFNIMTGEVIFGGVGAGLYGILLYCMLLFSLVFHEFGHAWIALRCGDDTAKRNTAKALERAATFLRRRVGQTLRLRRTPALEFHYDESIAGQDRIERLLKDLHAPDHDNDAES